ncbi:MAG: AbrB/MazE/SpoVT family DNA-binding domain-containing protein [Halobacteriota archaeon]|nr:AbrB/MazE/SpoVT family DNA-binding domain-containing protein [Halobacteriota archaeon]
METVKVSSKYQVVIPKKVRKTLGIKENDILLFEIDRRSNTVRLKKFDELLERHIGSIELDKDFKDLRNEFNERMTEEGTG